MKKQLSSPVLPLLTLGGGAVLMGLRGLIYAYGFDEKGILSASHPLHLTCLALAAAYLVFLAFRVRKLGGPNGAQENFAVGPWAVAAALAGTYLTVQFGIRRMEPGTLNLLRLAMTLLAALSMTASVFLRDRRGAAFRVLLCLYFCAEMLLRYRDWSGNPQLPDYVFHVLACVCLCLGAYHRLAFDVDLGHRRQLLYFGLASLFLCLAAAVGPEEWEFYLGSALWSAASLCRLKPPAPQEKAQ